MSVFKFILYNKNIYFVMKNFVMYIDLFLIIIEYFKI